MILNLQSADAELSKRLIDFASGLTYALDGGMQRVADKVFLLTPRNVECQPRSAPACSNAAASSNQAVSEEAGHRGEADAGMGDHCSRSASARTTRVFPGRASPYVFIVVYHPAALRVHPHVLGSASVLTLWLNRVQRFLYDVCRSVPARSSGASCRRSDS